MNNIFLRGYMYKEGEIDYKDYLNKLHKALPALELSVRVSPIEEEQKESLLSNINLIDRTGDGVKKVHDLIEQLPPDTKNKLLDTVKSMDTEQARELKEEYGGDLKKVVTTALSNVPVKDMTNLSEPRGGWIDFIKRSWQASPDDVSGIEKTIMNNPRIKTVLNKTVSNKERKQSSLSNPYYKYNSVKDLINIAGVGMKPEEAAEALSEGTSLSPERKNILNNNFRTLNNMAAATGGLLISRAKKPVKDIARNVGTRVAWNKGKKVVTKRALKKALAANSLKAFKGTPVVSLGFDAWDTYTGDWDKRMKDYKNWADFRYSREWKRLSPSERALFSMGKVLKAMTRPISDSAVSMEMATRKNRPDIEELPVKQNLDALKDTFIEGGRAVNNLKHKYNLNPAVAIQKSRNRVMKDRAARKGPDYPMLSSREDYLVNRFME